RPARSKAATADEGAPVLSVEAGPGNVPAVGFSFSQPEMAGNSTKSNIGNGLRRSAGMRGLLTRAWEA
ncbi:MAG TPA: hypothetical protein VEL06_00925, partial [Haliangiales bacterium]|nr:hypothetical protein [Haliangiales bacterium]